MKTLITGGLCALLGLAAAQVFAQDGTPNAGFSSVTAVPSDSAIRLGRPTPLTGSTIQPVHFMPASAALERPMPIFRAKAQDPDQLHQILPVGPSAVDTQPGVAKPMGPAVAGKPVPKQPATFAAPMPTPMPTQMPAQIVAPVPTMIAGPTPMPSNGVVYSTGPVGHVGNDCCVSTCTPYIDSCCTTVVGDACGMACGSCCDPCGHGWGHWLHGLCGHFGGGCFDDGCCLPRPCKWIRAEYLLWQLSDQRVPPLVGVGGTGVLPNTFVVYGNDQFEEDNHVRSGGRLAFGFWFPHHCNLGLDASGFTLGTRTSRFEIGSGPNGAPLITRLYFNRAPLGNTDPEIRNEEAAQIVAAPGEFRGALVIENSTQLWGFDVHLRKKLCCGPCSWLDGFVGYRHLQLSDTLSFGEVITDLRFDTVDPNGDPRLTERFVVREQIQTRNQFNGFQFGFEGEKRLHGRWSLSGSLKVALGNMHQTISINGSTNFINHIPAVGQGPGGNFVGVGGLYALATNIGTHERNRFTVIPEFGIKLGYDLTDHLRVYAGYNVLFLSNVVRAGEQIDRQINFIDLVPSPPRTEGPGLRPSRFVSPARPAVLFRTSDFWAQGGQFGLEYHW